MPVQVNGKVRGRLTVPAEASETGARADGARRSGRATRILPGKTVKKVVVAKGPARVLDRVVRKKVWLSVRKLRR